jgi:hypothetical protein
MLSAYFDVTVTTSLEEFNEYIGDKYYIITIFDIWLANDHDLKKTDTYCWEDVFGTEFINELKTNKHPIIFDGSSEPSVKATFDAVLNFCEYVNIEPKDVYICMSNAQSVALNLESYPYLAQYNLFSIDRFERDAIQVGISMSGLQEKFTFKEKKRFLCTNRKYTPDRAYLYFKLHQHNLLNNMHCTFRLDLIYKDDPLGLSNVIKDLSTQYSDSSIIEYLKTNFDSIEKSLPHTIKTNIYKSDFKKVFLYTLWNLAAHNSTDISLITETFREYPLLKTDIHYKNFYFITEKTYRTILMKQPFILFSNPYALKYLKESGYKTFSPFINETYDTIENTAARQNLIVHEVKRLSNMPKDEYEELLSNCKEIAEYNYQVLMGKKVDKFRNTVWTTDKLQAHYKDYSYEIPPFYFVHRYP